MTQNDYHPLVDTLRLYVGWLLSCLLFVEALGSYQILRHLPWSLPLVTDWVTSPMIIRVTFLVFLFLALSSLHTLLRKGLWTGLLLTLVGFLAFVFFSVNA
ncbi:hypothetical protein EXS70_04325 [Candidatus Peribacteria bacterium]|nr:hypothetical protein [Candidatus Peribacteria bacterium]